MTSYIPGSSIFRRFRNKTCVFEKDSDLAKRAPAGLFHIIVGTLKLSYDDVICTADFISMTHRLCLHSFEIDLSMSSDKTSGWINIEG